MKLRECPSPFWRQYYNSRSGHKIVFPYGTFELDSKCLFLIPDHQLFHSVAVAPAGVGQGLAAERTVRRQGVGLGLELCGKLVAGSFAALNQDGSIHDARGVHRVLRRPQGSGLQPTQISRLHDAALHKQLRPRCHAPFCRTAGRQFRPVHRQPWDVLPASTSSA